jgi:hypothetical protein
VNVVNFTVARLLFPPEGKTRHLDYDLSPIGVRAFVAVRMIRARLDASTDPEIDIRLTEDAMEAMAHTLRPSAFRLSVMDALADHVPEKPRQTTRPPWREPVTYTRDFNFNK